MSDKIPKKDTTAVGRTDIERISKLVPNKEDQKLIPVDRIKEALSRLLSSKKTQESDTRMEE